VKPNNLSTETIDSCRPNSHEPDDQTQKMSQPEQRLRIALATAAERWNKCKSKPAKVF
jgi:hypothetical protein